MPCKMHNYMPMRKLNGMCAKKLVMKNYPLLLNIYSLTKTKKMRKNYLMICLAVLFSIGANAQLNIFTDNYEPGITFVAFGGSTNVISIDATEAHSGTSSLKAEVTTGYTGGAFSNSTIQNLSAYNCVSFWVKSSAAKTLNVTGLSNNGISAVWQTEYINIPVTTSWTKVIIPIPDPAKDTAETGMFHFAEGSDEGAYTLWFDDIKYEKLSNSKIGTPTASFNTETISRFVGDSFFPGGVTCSFPVNNVSQTLNIVSRWFSFSSSNNTVAKVDGTATGSAKAVGTATITGKLGSVNASGALTVNVSAAVVPTVAAPTPPVRNSSDVISLFSGAYTDLAGTDWFPNWGQSTVVTDVSIAGNPTKKYTNFNYQGVQFLNAVDADAAGMTKLHIDIWTPNVTTFDVYPIQPGQPEAAKSLSPTPLIWNSYDIDLATIGTMPLDSIIQFKFVSTPFGGTNVWLDNIYFYKGTGICCAAPTGLKAQASSITATTAKPKWKESSCGSGLSYQLQYKPVSSGTWTTVTVTGLSKTIKNLTPSTTYQWQVATICQASPLILSAYTTGPNFTTLSAAKSLVANKSNATVASGLSASIFPNPVKNRSLLSINSESAVSVGITDLSGKMLWQSLNVNARQINLPAERFSPGIYLVIINNGKETKTIKLVKE